MRRLNCWPPVTLQNGKFAEVLRENGPGTPIGDQEVPPSSTHESRDRISPRESAWQTEAKKREQMESGHRKYCRRRAILLGDEPDRYLEITRAAPARRENFAAAGPNGLDQEVGEVSP